MWSLQGWCTGFCLSILQNSFNFFWWLQFTLQLSNTLVWLFPAVQTFSVLPVICFSVFFMTSSSISASLITFSSLCVLHARPFRLHTDKEQQRYKCCFIAIAQTINLPRAWGAKVVYSREQRVHLSGAPHSMRHKGAPEIREGTEALKPLIPPLQLPSIPDYAWMK